MRVQAEFVRSTCGSRRFIRQPFISLCPLRLESMFLGVVAVTLDERNRSRLPIKFGNVFISQSEFDGDLLHTLFAYPLPKGRGVRSQGF
jgi:hypothetical protein